jgi:hypothetical protein
MVAWGRGGGMSGSLLPLFVADPFREVCDHCAKLSLDTCQPIWHVRNSILKFHCATCLGKKLGCSFSKMPWPVSRPPVVLRGQAAIVRREGEALKKRLSVHGGASDPAPPVEVAESDSGRVAKKARSAPVLRKAVSEGSSKPKPRTRGRGKAAKQKVPSPSPSVVSSLPSGPQQPLPSSSHPTVSGLATSSTLPYALPPGDSLTVFFDDLQPFFPENIREDSSSFSLSSVLARLRSVRTREEAQWRVFLETHEGRRAMIDSLEGLLVGQVQRRCLAEGLPVPSRLLPQGESPSESSAEVPSEPGDVGSDDAEAAPGRGDRSGGREESMGAEPMTGREGLDVVE